MADSKIKLDFLALGAQKAGTTALHEMLQAHPDIALPALKETRFFADPAKTGLGRQWYDAQFAAKPSATLRGEIDPEYLYAPQAAENIDTLAEVEKFIILLRHPLDRAFSHHQMSERRGYETLSFGEALQAEASRLANDADGFAVDHLGYCARSLYSAQIARFKSRFPLAQFLYLRSDQLNGSGYQDVCAFLGIAPEIKDEDEMPRANSANAPRNKLLRDLLYAPSGKSGLRQAIARMLPSSFKVKVFLFLEKWNQKPQSVDKQAALREAPAKIAETMAVDLRETAGLTGLDLSDWIADLEARATKGAEG